MQKSARILGQEYGLTAEEMNRVLFKLGFLEGEPGDYSMTEKAQPYATEKEYHRGTGGYSFYNRYWTTRTYDDSIKEVLDVTPELVREVRDEIAMARAARYVIQAEVEEKTNDEFLENSVTEKAEIEEREQTDIEIEELIAKWEKAGKIGLIFCGVVIVGYGIYKVTPKVKEWWKKRKESLEEDNNAA